MSCQQIKLDRWFNWFQDQVERNVLHHSLTCDRLMRLNGAANHPFESIQGLTKPAIPISMSRIKVTRLSNLRPSFVPNFNPS